MGNLSGMNSSTYAVITGSGSYLPSQIVPNSHFLQHQFFDAEGKKLDKSNEEIICKFKDITGIEERRYVKDDQMASDIGFLAAEQALKSSHVDKETLDYIILAQNFGDIHHDSNRGEFLPTLASRVKQKLDIRNPNTVAYDLPFGCAGWVQGLIQANGLIKSGEAKKILVIAAETLSRISDPHDRDSMIYADGAGAVVIEAKESNTPIGIIASHSETYSNEQTYIIQMNKSFNPDHHHRDIFLKMNGHKLYEYALKLVPAVIKTAIQKAGLSISDIDKLLIHQANQKMDQAILQRLGGLYNTSLPAEMMPMTISWLGNSSVATVPTLYDLMIKGQIKDQRIRKGSYINFTAVGAGINLNSLVYRIPE